MRQRRMTAFRSGLGAGNYYNQEEDVNPNAYLVNLADCMLVLSCGLMVSLVVAWSVQLPSGSEIQQVSDMTEVDNVSNVTDISQQTGTSYTEIGTVYQDADGNLYMITQTTDDSSTDTTSTDTSTSSS
jgi:hypothetical protein